MVKFDIRVNKDLWIKDRWCTITLNSFKSPLLRCKGCCFVLRKDKHTYECQLGKACLLKERFIYKEKI